MHKRFPLVIFSALAIAAGITVIGLEKIDKKEKTFLSYKIRPSSSIQSPSRIGINLGQWTSWGAQQYGTNVLMNPGFEGELDRIIVIVSLVDEKSFSDEAGWGYPDHDWDEAAFEIRTGKSVGQQGIVKKSLNSGLEGFPQYFTDKTLPPIEANDVIVLTKVRRPDPPDFWQSETPLRTTIDTAVIRPQSPGVQSIKLMPSKNEQGSIVAFLDTISDRAGNLLPVNGSWHFSVWAKAKKPRGELRASFQRLNGGLPFFDKTFDLTTEWQEYNLTFEAKDQEAPGSLRLSLSTEEAGNDVWIDDVFLGQKHSVETPFRSQVVDVLKELNPSYLREYPPLGDAWENQIASPFERKPWLARLSGGRNEPIYNYSLPEFFHLCKQIDANPWLILPPTFSDYESKKLGRYLADNKFPEIILEFGHENWNWMFRPQGIPYHNPHGKLAKRDFDLISESAGKGTNIRFLVNGQFAAPWTSVQFLEDTPNADGVAIAPYFLYTLDKATPDESALTMLFQEDSGNLQENADEVYAKDLSLAINEINLHTTRGSSKAFERNRLVAGAASGSALAKRLIQSLFIGADPVMVYTLAQFDTPAWEIPDFVSLWGVVRDFGPPVRYRPTGLAMKLLNQVIQGNLHTAMPIDDTSLEAGKVTIAAFRSEEGWTLAAVSELSLPASIEIEFPDDGVPLPNTQSTIKAATPFDTNEDDERVKIVNRSLKPKGRTITFTIPAWGMSVLNL